MPMTKMKGLESLAFLYFVIDELEVKMPTLLARPDPTPRICSNLHKSCALLRELYDLVMGSGLVMSAVDALRAKECLVGHATMLRRAGAKLAPKHHWAYHMMQDIPRNGNPRFYTTLPDESLNQIMKHIAQSYTQVPSKDFALGVLLKYIVWCRTEERHW